MTLGMSAVASAAHNDTHQSAREARNTTTRVNDSREDSLWHRAGTPFRYAGRTGMTVLRSPLIVGETLTGERRFLSDDGFMRRADDIAGPAEQATISIPMGRGQRTPVVANSFDRD